MLEVEQDDLRSSLIIFLLVIYDMLLSRFEIVCLFTQVDSDTTSDAMRTKLRGHHNAAVYALVSIPHGYDIATIFELDPTTMTKEPTVPRYALSSYLLSLLVGHGFDCQPFHCHAMALGKLFTHASVTKQYNLILAT